jgi:hypothetical protein
MFATRSLGVFSVVVCLAAGACAGSSAPAPIAGEAAPIAAKPDNCTEMEPADVLIVGGRWRDQPVQVFIDTAAPSGSISKGIAAQLTPKKGVALRLAGAAGRWRESPAYDLSGLELAGRTMALETVRVDASGHMGYDIQLGAEQLADFVVDIDGRHGRLCLYEASHAVDVPLTEMRFGIRGDLRSDIVVDAEIGGSQLASIIVDTGAGISCLNEELVPTVTHTEAEPVESIDSTGVRATQRTIEVAEVCVLGVCAVDHRFMVEPDISELVGHPVRGIIGMPFLATRRLILDYPGRRIGIQ